MTPVSPRLRLLAALGVVLLASTPATAASAAKDAARSAVDPQRLSEITRTLASDEFEGRAPGTPGETKTVAYLVEQFKAAGLEPGGQGGSYTQVVPLLHTQMPVDADMSVTVAGKRTPLRQQEQMAALSLRPVDRVQIADAPLVFVGYGVSAPERGWDDYKDTDLRGKVAVYLVNDPDFEAVAGDD
ncbi:MAG: peptidase M20, partial [Gammaproteobacteria bacterium]|nr:peptidase M20 [Gammaproteobacteria bacterium]